MFIFSLSLISDIRETYHEDSDWSFNISQSNIKHRLNSLLKMQSPIDTTCCETRNLASPDLLLNIGPSPTSRSLGVPSHGTFHVPQNQNGNFSGSFSDGIQWFIIDLPCLYFQTHMLLFLTVLHSASHLSFVSNPKLAAKIFIAHFA